MIAMFNIVFGWLLAGLGVFVFSTENEHRYPRGLFLFSGLVLSIFGFLMFVVGIVALFV